MTAAYDHYPELHELVEQLEPERAGEVRAHLLRLVRPDGPGLRVLGVDTSPILAALNRRDPDHAGWRKMLDEHAREMLVTPSPNA